MKKTINSNIGGYAFMVEQDAYEELERYLDEIKGCYAENGNGQEIVGDIETRIGEVLSEMKGGYEVITADMVSAVRERIGNPSVLQEAEEGEKNEKSRNGSIRKHLYRDMDNRKLAGVCAGLAAYTNVDAIWFRLAWTCLFFLGLFTDWKWIFRDGSFGLIVMLSYCIMWLCMPQARTVEQKCRLHGEPANLHQFKGYVPESERTINRRRPLLGRILCMLAGVMLLTAGSGCLIGGVFTPVVMNAAKTDIRINFKVEEMGSWTDYADNTLNLLTGSTFWWLASAFLLLMGIGMCYAGIVIIFDVKGPRWHPGLIIFLLWLLSLAALTAYSAYFIFFGGVGIPF